MSTDWKERREKSQRLDEDCRRRGKDPCTCGPPPNPYDVYCPVHLECSACEGAGSVDCETCHGAGVRDLREVRRV